MRPYLANHAALKLVVHAEFAPDYVAVARLEIDRPRGAGVSAAVRDCAGRGGGLLFVYASDLPEIRALETYRPNVVTEIYADDGQLVGSFALQRRILMTYEQCPKILNNAVTSIEDQHFEEHWGIDFPRIAERGVAQDFDSTAYGEGASTITMQLAGDLFLDRTDSSFRRKMQETLLALQIERHYTKPQIFTMYCNQVYLAHGNYGFEAASEYYFGKPVGDLKLQEAALLAGHGPRAEIFAAD